MSHTDASEGGVEQDGGTPASGDVDSRTAAVGSRSGRGREGAPASAATDDAVAADGTAPAGGVDALGRRRFLAGAGVAGVVGLAGCAGGGFGGPLAVNSVESAQAAVVQIVSQGSFVDPEVGAVLNSAGSGSGFVVDPSGIAVTNNHVVTGAATLEVFVDGRSYNAQVLGVSECSDLAVIRIAGEGFTALEWYDGPVETNLEVWALGFPLGDPNYTVTRGIVSKAQAGGETSWASVDSVIEHDARIRPGNSGGPLVDQRGRVVGVNYAGESRFDINLAIGADLARGIVDQLREGRNVNSIGVNGRAVRSEDGSLSGVWVSSVESGSPAFRADIAPGDVIVRMEGLTLARDGTMRDYCDVLRSRTESDVLAVQVLRFSTGQVLAGEINGSPLEAVVSPAEVAPDGAADGGASGDADADADADAGDGRPYARYRRVTDDTGVISVDVPEAWTDVDGRPSGDGPNVQVAPDLRGFLDGYATPGVEIQVSREYSRNVDAVLDEVRFSACGYAGRQPYDDGVYAGKLDLYEACEGRETSIVHVAAVPADRSYTVRVIVQLVSERDVDALETIIASFGVSDSF
jgi:serine protease Do